MIRKLEELTGNASSLGQAGLDLARAEATALAGELKLSGKAFVRILLLFAGCLFLLFWAIAVLVVVGIEVGALWLPRWGAALVVLGVLLLAVFVVGWLAWRRLNSLEMPAATVRRRLQDHLDWWQRRIVDRDH